MAKFGQQSSLQETRRSRHCIGMPGFELCIARVGTGPGAREFPTSRLSMLRSRSRGYHGLQRRYEYKYLGEENRTEYR